MSKMASGNAVAEIAALIGDPARANIILALMGGHALTAGELARSAGVTPQTTSGHLAKLTEARLVAVEKQGRHRYYRLASQDVAQTMQALMVVAVAGPARHHPIGPRDEALRIARTCYDHVAGRLAVALVDALSARDFIALNEDAALVTEDGERFLADFGLDLAGARNAKRPLCRTCLDWSERRPHLAGRLGAALLCRLLDIQWVRRTPGSRVLSVTPEGQKGFVDVFALSPDWMRRVSPVPALRLAASPD
jgi:DNA-binding transcriptional ArsR family regulator